MHFSKQRCTIRRKHCSLYAVKSSVRSIHHLYSDGYTTVIHNFFDVAEPKVNYKHLEI